MHLRHAVLALSLAACSGNALAVNTFWTGNAGDGRWNNANNWSPAHVPNNLDAVYIGSNGPTVIYEGEIGVAASVSCTSELSVRGGLYVTGTALLAGTTYVFGAHPTFTANNIEITGTLEFYSGSLDHYTTSGTTHVAAGGHLNVHPSANVSTSTTLIVDGTMDINDATFTSSGSANFPIGMIAGSGGRISINGDSVIHGNAYTYLANDGLVTLSGFQTLPRVDADMKFFNGPSGVLRVEGGCYAQIGNPVQITAPTGVLNSGYWYIKDSSTLLFPDGRSVTSIESNGHVILEGPGAVFHNLVHLNSIKSTLSLRGGADLSVNGPLGGFLVHQGYLDLASGSRLSVEGAFTCAPNSSTIFYLTGMSTNRAGTIYARDTAHLDGSALVVFDTGFAAPFVNPPLPIVETGLVGGGLDGVYSSLQYSNPIGQVGASYDANTLSLALSCRADLNTDGYVDDADFVIFASSYDLLECFDINMPYNCPADLNGDGLVDDADFILFAGAYDTLICE